MAKRWYDQWRCTQCGLTLTLEKGKKPPDKCPNCNATNSWEQIAYYPTPDVEPKWGPGPVPH